MSSIWNDRSGSNRDYGRDHAGVRDEPSYNYNFSTWNDVLKATGQPKSLYEDGWNFLDERPPRDFPMDFPIDYETDDLNFGYLRNLPEFYHWTTDDGVFHTKLDLQLLRDGVPIIELFRRGPVFFPWERNDLRCDGNLRTLETCEVLVRRVEENNRLGFRHPTRRTASVSVRPAEPFHIHEEADEVHAREHSDDIHICQPPKYRTNHANNSQFASDGHLHAHHPPCVQDDLISPRTVPETVRTHHRPTKRTVDSSNEEILRAIEQKLRESDQRRAEETRKEHLARVPYDLRPHVQAGPSKQPTTIHQYNIEDSFEDSFQPTEPVSHTISNKDQTVHVHIPPKLDIIHHHIGPKSFQTKTIPFSKETRREMDDMQDLIAQMKERLDGSRFQHPLRTPRMFGPSSTQTFPDMISFSSSSSYTSDDDAPLTRGDRQDALERQKKSVESWEKIAKNSWARYEASRARYEAARARLEGTDKQDGEGAIGESKGSEEQVSESVIGASKGKEKEVARDI